MRRSELKTIFISEIVSLDKRKSVPFFIFESNLLLAVILQHLSTCHTIAIRVLLLLKVRHAYVLYRLVFDLNRHEGAGLDRKLAAACRC